MREAGSVGGACGILGGASMIAVRRLVMLGLLPAIAADVAPWAPPVASVSATVVSAQRSPVIPAGRVTLAGNVHPMARAELDIGRLDSAVTLSGLSLFFRMPPERRALERRAVTQVQDPGSSRYHQWLSPEQYAAEFGATREDVARAAEWLASRGLSVDGPSRTGTRLRFQGTVAQIEQAFQTEMHEYRVRGQDHFAMSRAPSMPAELAGGVLGLHGLHDFLAKAPPHQMRPQYALPVTGADGGPTSFPVLAPADFAKIYDLDGLYAANITGAGVTIAVAGRSDYNDADVAAFRSTFGLPPNQPIRVLVPNTGPPSVTDAADLAEAELNLEWAGAVAPDATIKFVYSGTGRNSGALDAMLYAIEQHSAPVLSQSYYECENWVTPVDASVEEDYADIASLEGMTVVVAAGDMGAAGCDSQSELAASLGKAVLYPASVPSFVAVGGSQFQLTPSNQATYLNAQLDAISYIPETGWNETLFDVDAGYGGLGAGGGGASRLFSKPYWQLPNTPHDGSRDLPDVALSASSDTLPYAVSMSWTASDGDAQALQPQALTAYGGTSVSAPAFAGVLALLNQAVSNAHPGMPVGLGNANLELYGLANSAASSDAFHDITGGDNVVPCQPGSPDCPASPPYQFGYAAGPGYDQVTGLGSIDVANLVAAWTALTPTSTVLHVAASGSAEGSPLNLTATVASKATSNAMTGSVTFYFVASGDGGAGLSGTLGTAQLTASTSSGMEGGTASLMATAPGGLDGSGVSIGAFYGGDPHYLPSWSALSSVSGTSTLEICPGSVTLEVGQAFTFVATGGKPPLQWSTHADKTCTQINDQIACSSVDGGAFTAGQKAGSVTVVAVDEYATEVTAQVTVTSASPDGAAPPPPTVPCTPDGGGSDAAPQDAGGPDATTDAEADGSADVGPSSSNAGGCGCVAAGGGSDDLLGCAGALLLLAAIGRRRATGAARAGRTS